MSYSFVSSGLTLMQYLTPPSSPTQLVRPDSPILPPTPTHEIAADITDHDPTPTVASPSQAFGTERPKLRKRRSSLTVNTSPLVQLKGSYRSATTATQRQNRSRSGSVNDFTQPCPVNFPIEEVKIVGRLRSGSVGNSLRTRRVIRGARPPPSTPLPPLPTSPAVPSSAPHLGGFRLSAEAVRHRPIVAKALTLGSLEQVVPGSQTALYELDAEYPFKPMVEGPEDIAMNEN